MNAGRDVERLIATWLVEEAPGQAPDRILETAAERIDQTNQRRLVAEWRDPMYVTMRGLVAAAVIAAVLIGGALFFLKGAPSSDVGATPSPGSSVTASPSPDNLSLLADYRSEWGAICTAATNLPPLPNIDLWSADVLYEPTMSASDRALSLEVGRAIADLGDALADQLDGLVAPPALAIEHVAYVTRLRDVVGLIRHEVDLLEAGTLDEARAVDEATNPLSRLREQYETRNGLKPCP